MADHGFFISDCVRLYCAEVKCPAFLKGRKQLSVNAVEETRKLARVRIHVERVTRLLKRGDNGFALIDKAIIVCCALINLCPPIITCV